MSVLRRAYVEVEPDVSGFDTTLKAKLQAQDPGGKAGKQVGGQLNRALKRFDLAPIDVKADPKSALAGIAVAEARLRELSGQAATVEVKVQTEKALGQLTRFRKSLGDVTEDAGPEAAVGFISRFGAKLGPLLSGLPIATPMGAALGGAAIAAAPLVGSAVAGAIIGGVGIGGVAGGLALAAKDVRVKSAIDGLGETLQGRLNRAGGAFVQPALAGIADIQKTLNQIDIEGIFRDASRYVPSLIGGIGDALAGLSTGIRALIANAGPAVDAIGDGIAAIGTSLGAGLKSLSDNGPAAAEALRTVLGVVSLGINSTFMLVNALTELYEINRKIGGDFGLQLVLKATGQEMANVGTFARRTAGEVDLSAEALQRAETESKNLTEAQKAATTAQNQLTASLGQLQAGGQGAALIANNLRTAMDSLYGAAIRNTDANESYEASWDSLSGSVKLNNATLSINTSEGRSNRDALQDLLASNNDLYLANINAGVSIEAARKKHEARTRAIREESIRLGLNKDKTQDLIKTYGQIPGRKTTDLVVDGITQVVIELKRVYLAQRALAEGKTINQVRYEGTAAMRSLLADGGPVHGPGGPTEDKVPAMLSNGEYVIKAASTAKLGAQQLDYLNKYGELPAFAKGGLVAPVETSPKMRFPVDVRDSYVMPRALALSKVTPVFSRDWPSSPMAQRGDSGIWKSVLRLIKSGPKSGSFGNSYRPGDPKWHGSGRAVDWMGYNQDPLATFLASKKPLELIHRTRNRDYAYTRGRNKGSFNNALMEAHRNHIHIAMANGGVIKEPVAGVGLSSGKSYSFGERGPETVTPGVGTGTVIINVNLPPGVVISSKKAAEDLLVEAYKTAKSARRIP